MGVYACVRSESAGWEYCISNRPFDLEKSEYEHVC